jgi:hypothetical protein
MAYIEDDAVQHLLLRDPLDVLLTHQGPASVQGDHGSETLDLLLEAGLARFWFHGHSTPVRTPTTVGRTEVVPLGDVAFSGGTPGLHGWAILDLDGDKHELAVEPPPGWRTVRRHHWHSTERGLLVHPDLVPFLE